MSAPVTVPVTVDPEAAELVAELEMQVELERMLEQARQMIAGLRHLHVAYEPPYDTGPAPAVGWTKVPVGQSCQDPCRLNLVDAVVSQADAI